MFNEEKWHWPCMICSSMMLYIIYYVRLKRRTFMILLPILWKHNNERLLKYQIKLQNMIIGFCKIFIYNHSIRIILDLTLKVTKKIAVKYWLSKNIFSKNVSSLHLELKEIVIISKFLASISFSNYHIMF